MDLRGRRGWEGDLCAGYFVGKKEFLSTHINLNNPSAPEFILIIIPEWFNNMPPLERSTIATCAEVALVVVPLLILLLKAAGELLACVLPVPPRAVPMICFLPVLTEVVLGALRWPFALGEEAEEVRRRRR